jgi:TetR/AcrR family transcriptional regulator, mexJK operon transcriptional repressor
MGMTLSSRELAKQQQIRTAAQELFLHNGFSATSTDAIAAKAGVSKQTLYRYYSSKEILLSDVLEQLINNFPSSSFALTENIQAVQNREQLKQFLLTFATQFINNLMHENYIALMRIIVFESARVPELGQLFKKTIPARIIHNLTSILVCASQKGLAHYTDEETTVRMLIGPLLTYVILDGLLKTDQYSQPPDKSQIERIVSMFMQVI